MTNVSDEYGERFYQEIAILSIADLLLVSFDLYFKRKTGQINFVYLNDIKKYKMNEHFSLDII